MRSKPSAAGQEQRFARAVGQHEVARGRSVRAQHEALEPIHRERERAERRRLQFDPIAAFVAAGQHPAHEVTARQVGARQRGLLAATTQHAQHARRLDAFFTPLRAQRQRAVLLGANAVRERRAPVQQQDFERRGLGPQRGRPTGQRRRDGEQENEEATNRAHARMSPLRRTPRGSPASLARPALRPQHRKFASITYKPRKEKEIRTKNHSCEVRHIRGTGFAFARAPSRRRSASWCARDELSRRQALRPQAPRGPPRTSRRAPVRNPQPLRDSPSRT